jgi:hypothetical protein
MNPSSKRGDEDEMMLVFNLESQHGLSTSFAFAVVGNIVRGTGVISAQFGSFGSLGAWQSPFPLETICRFN